MKPQRPLRSQKNILLCRVLAISAFFLVFISPRSGYATPGSRGAFVVPIVDGLALDEVDLVEHVGTPKTTAGCGRCCPLRPSDGDVLL